MSAVFSPLKMRFIFVGNGGIEGIEEPLTLSGGLVTSFYLKGLRGSVSVF